MKAPLQILFAPGSGAGKDHPWMEAWAQRLGSPRPLQPMARHLLVFRVHRQHDAGVAELRQRGEDGPRSGRWAVGSAEHRDRAWSQQGVEVHAAVGGGAAARARDTQAAPARAGASTSSGALIVVPRSRTPRPS